MKQHQWTLFVSIFFLFASLTSCTIETETHFSKDFSGSQVVSVNAAEMMGMMSAFGGQDGGDMDFFNQINDPSFADTLAMMEDSLSRAFAGTGADNFSMAVSQEGLVSMGYDFKDIETFERMMLRAEELQAKSSATGDDMMGMMSGLVGGGFKKDGSWLVIPLSQKDMFEDMKENMPGDGGEMSDDELKETMKMMEGLMGGSISFKNVYTFDKSIKKIKTDIPYTQDGNQLTVEYTLGKMMEWMENDTDATIKLKLK